VKLGRKIKLLRQEKNLSQLQLGWALYGRNQVDERTIQARIADLEADRIEPSLDEVKMICEFFEIPGTCFLGIGPFKSLDRDMKGIIRNLYQNLLTIAAIGDPEFIKAVDKGVMKIAQVAKKLKHKEADLSRLEQIERDYYKLKKQLQELKKEAVEDTRKATRKRMPGNLTLVATGKGGINNDRREFKETEEREKLESNGSG
jgi:transcriptional regulator with XRE-family HTH domain